MKHTECAKKKKNLPKGYVSLCYMEATGVLAVWVIPGQASGRGSSPSASHARLVTDTRCRRVRGNLECHSYSMAWTRHLMHLLTCLWPKQCMVEPRVGLGYGQIPGRLCKSQAVGRDVELWSHLWWRRGGDNWDYDLIYDMHFQKWIIYFLVLKKYWEWCHCCVCFMALGHHCQHKYCF